MHKIQSLQYTVSGTGLLHSLLVYNVNNVNVLLKKKTSEKITIRANDFNETNISSIVFVLLGEDGRLKVF